MTRQPCVIERVKVYSIHAALHLISFGKNASFQRCMQLSWWWDVSLWSTRTISGVDVDKSCLRNPGRWPVFQPFQMFPMRLWTKLNWFVDHRFTTCTTVYMIKYCRVFRQFKNISNLEPQNISFFQIHILLMFSIMVPFRDPWKTSKSWSVAIHRLMFPNIPSSNGGSKQVMMCMWKESVVMQRGLSAKPRPEKRIDDRVQSTESEERSWRGSAKG